MDASQYWPFAWEYSIWNATVAAQQFWIADHEPHIFSNAIDWAYAAFFHSDFTQQIWNLPEEILFSHVVTTLNDAFQTELAQEDEGYESWSESFNISTLSAEHQEDLSLNPANFGQSPTTPEHHEESSPHSHRCCSLTCHPLVFTSPNDESPVRPCEWCSPHSSTNARSPAHRRADPSPSVHHNQCNHITSTTDQFLTEACDDDTTSSEEYFPTVPLDDDIWAEELVVDRHLCIHKRPDEPNHQCPYHCPYESTTFRMDLLQSTPWDEAVFNYEQMDFSETSSDLPNIMTTTSDNDIPNLVDISKCLDNIQHEAWFEQTFSLTLPKITKKMIYKDVCMNIIYIIKTRCSLNIPFVKCKLLYWYIVYRVCILCPYSYTTTKVLKGTMAHHGKLITD